MLSSIPKRILRDTAAFSVPAGIDRYQKPTVLCYSVQNVHLQSDNHTVRGRDNTEVTLRGILFVDARHSVPVLDFRALQESAQLAGGVMSCTVTDRRGGVTGPYTVQTVEGLPDDEGNLHHWELGLV